MWSALKQYSPSTVHRCQIERLLDGDFSAVIPTPEVYYSSFGFGIYVNAWSGWQPVWYGHRSADLIRRPVMALTSGATKP
jgi:hypothetical protein